MLLPFLLLKQDGRDLVSVRAGTLPIVLTAPHGGRSAIPGVEPRTGSKTSKGFSVAFDTDSDELAEALADEIEHRTGERPTLIVARFSRKYVDANRPAADAYESPLGKPVYDAYHAAVEKARQDILKRFGTGLLLDIHGQGRRSDAIFRGTADGKTVRHLTKAYGMAALTGKDGLLGGLEAKGYRFVPSCAEPESKEDPSFDGGWTVRHYASDDFDAVQLETGISLRRDKRAQTARDLAEAVCAFAKRYMPKVKREAGKD